MFLMRCKKDPRTKMIKPDRKSTRLNSSHSQTSYAVFCLKKKSIKVEPLTCSIGAELSNVDLGAASQDAGLISEIRALLLQYKVVFFRDQEITRAQHVAFARRFGELEDHQVAGSDPDHPGLVRIYKSPEQPNVLYERRPPKSTLFPYTTLFR